MAGVRPGKNPNRYNNAHLNTNRVYDILILFLGNNKDALYFLIFQVMSNNNNLNKNGTKTPHDILKWIHRFI